MRKLTFKLSAHKNLNVNEAIAKASTPLAGRQITVNAIEKSSLKTIKCREYAIVLNHRLRHYKSKTENVRTRRVPFECDIKEMGVIDP